MKNYKIWLSDGYCFIIPAHDKKEAVEKFTRTAPWTDIADVAEVG